MKATIPLRFAIVTVLGLGLASCAAYTSAMNSALSNMKAVSGSFKVVNTMSVPVCGVSVFHEKTPSREDNDLHGKTLPPGESAEVDVPHLGEMTDDQPDKGFGMRVYGCKKEAFQVERGGLLATIKDINVRGTEPVAIR